MRFKLLVMSKHVRAYIKMSSARTSGSGRPSIIKVTWTHVIIIIISELSPSSLNVWNKPERDTLLW